MRIENGQLKDVIDPVDMQDAMTMNSAMNTAASIPRVWVNGVQKSSVKNYYASSTVSSGAVTFNLTDDGTATGNPVFTNVYVQSANLFVLDTANQYQMGGLSLAGTKKTITFNINRIGLSLGILTFTSAANGITVYLQIAGD